MSSFFFSFCFRGVSYLLTCRFSATSRIGKPKYLGGGQCDGKQKYVSNVHLSYTKHTTCAHPSYTAWYRSQKIKKDRKREEVKYQTG